MTPAPGFCISGGPKWQDFGPSRHQRQPQSGQHLSAIADSKADYAVSFHQEGNRS